MKLITLAALMGTLNTVTVEKRHHHTKVNYVQYDENLNPLNLPELIGAKIATLEPIEQNTTQSLSVEQEPVVDETFVPELDFIDRNDHIGYDNLAIAQARAQVKISKTVPAKGRYCTLNDFAVVYYRGWDQTGALRFDNYQGGPNNNAKIFRIGHYQASKCWDIALQQLKQGETARVFCPGELDQGGSPNQHTHFGSGWLPANTDMTYEIQVNECALKPKSFKPSKIIPELIDGDDMDPTHLYQLRSVTRNKFGKQMVLEVAPNDKYAPMVTGVYNVYLAEKKAYEPRQNFHYDSEDNLIQSQYLPGSALMEGYNNNLVMYYNKNLARQRFTFDLEDHHIVCGDTQNIVAVEEGLVGKVANLITKVNGLETRSMFECDQNGQLGHEHHH